MNNIGIYVNSPTANGKDGTLSSSGDISSAINVGTLSSNSNQESNPVKVAVRCTPGYQSTTGNVIIQPIGTTASDWAIAMDNGGSPGTWSTWGGSISLQNFTILDSNCIFWVKAKAVSGETEGSDTSVKISVTVPSIILIPTLSKPSILAVSNLANQVTVTLSVVSSSNYNDAITYDVYIGGVQKDTGLSATSLSGGKTYTGIPPGTQSVYVLAHDQHNLTSQSAIVNAPVLAPAFTQTPSINAVPAQANQVTITLTTPASTNTGNTILYDVYINNSFVETDTQATLVAGKTINSVPSGTDAIYITAKDGTLTQNSNTQTVIVTSSINPAPIFGTQPYIYNHTNNSITLRYSASNLDANNQPESIIHRYSLNGGTWQNSIVTDLGSGFYEVIISGLVFGSTYNIKINISDMANPDGVASNNVQGTTDNYPPSFSVQPSISSQDYQSVTLVYTASDPEGVALQHAISIDGGAYSAITPTNLGSNQYQYKQIGLNPGNHNISIQISDGVNNVLSGVIPVTIVNNFPVFTVQPDKSAVTQTTATISYSATDDSGITTHEISLDNGATYVTITPSGTAPNFTYPLTGLVNGTTYQVIVRVGDGLSQKTTSTVLSLTTVTNQAPSFSIQPSVYGTPTTSSITLQYTATDDLAVTSHQYSLGGAYLSDGVMSDLGSGQYRLTINNLVANTPYTITIKLLDGSGLSVISNPVSVSTAAVNQVPVASGVTISGTPSVGSVLTGNYTYSDSDGEVESGSTYKWYKDTQSSGATKSAISGATSKTYTVQSSDSGYYLFFEVTPKDVSGAGLSVVSSINMYVAVPDINEPFNGASGSAPNATYFSTAIAGTPASSYPKVVLNGSGYCEVGTAGGDQGALLIRKDKVTKTTRIRKILANTQYTNGYQKIALVNSGSTPSPGLGTNYNAMRVAEFQLIGASVQITMPGGGTTTVSGLAVKTDYVFQIETNPTQVRLSVLNSAETSVLGQSAWVNWSGSTDSMWLIMGDPITDSSWTGSLMIGNYIEYVMDAPILSIAEGVMQNTLTFSGGAGATFDIYRGTSPGVDTTGAPLVSGATSPYIDTNVVSGQIYYYKVMANLSGSSKTSSEANGKPYMSSTSITFDGANGSIPDTTYFNVLSAGAGTVTLDGSGNSKVYTPTAADNALLIWKTPIPKNQHTTKIKFKVPSQPTGDFKIALVSNPTVPSTIGGYTTVGGFGLTGNQVHLPVVGAGETYVNIDMTNYWIVIIEFTGTQYQLTVKNSTQTTTVQASGWYNYPASGDSLYVIMGDEDSATSSGTLLIDTYSDYVY